MSYINLWAHIVWSTKYRRPLLEKNVRPILFDHIFKNAREKGIHVDCVNGFSDHVHCLVSLKEKMPVMEVVQLLKGESSFWYNRQSLSSIRLEWQNDYYISSVSPRSIPEVRMYIHNQEEHHRERSFGEELERFLSNEEWLLAEAGSDKG